ncbi:biosynthetic aromatic amino acid aminotransferase beta [Cutibacterium acnes JCM 18916]|nr:biosynthetic aromatic amino acid aminotransferase beta [Cutibacterium acnes JCM 18916]
MKLSSNENPFEPLPSVVEAVTRTLPRFNRYPLMSAEEVRSTIAGHFGVDVSQVAVGAGSTEVASQLMHALAGAGDEIIFPWRSFEAYPILTKVAGATPIPVPLTVDLRHDLDAMADAITDRTRVIFLCTPNNPTGTVLHTDEVVEFLARVPENVVVVMDEAYCHFNRTMPLWMGSLFSKITPTSSCCGPSPRPTGWPGCVLVSPSPPPRSATTCDVSPLPSR